MSCSRGSLLPDQTRGERVEFAARGLARPLDFGPRLGERASPRMGVEVLARLGEGRGRHVAGGGDDAVLHRAVLAHQDRQRLVGFEPHEFDLLQPDVVLRRQHEAGAAGEVG